MASSPVKPTTVFGQIILGQSPATVLHDDDKVDKHEWTVSSLRLNNFQQCMAIDSNNPLAPVHFLVIPKKNIDNLSYIEEEDQAVSWKKKLLNMSMIWLIFS